MPWEWDARMSCSSSRAASPSVRPKFIRSITMLRLAIQRLGLVVSSQLGQNDAEHHQAGLAIVRRLTEAHLDVLLPELARSLTSLGVVLTELGRHDEAQALDRQAQHGDRPDEFRTDRGRGCTRA